MTALCAEMVFPGYISDHFRTMIKKHKLKKIRFHDLRHSCASLLLANGVSMKEIQEWLGHSNFNLTLNVYSHQFQTAQARVAEAMDGAFVFLQNKQNA